MVAEILFFFLCRGIEKNKNPKRGAKRRRVYIDGGLRKSRGGEFNRLGLGFVWNYSSNSRLV
jgi:hypothetical protein